MATAQQSFGGDANFTATRWSVVLLAGETQSPDSDYALEKLCQAYWYPLYVFVRRRGHTEHEAQDLTQEFFCRLIERRMLRSVDQRKGKFRSFLLAAMKNFLANEWDRSQAQKRGGGQPHFSLDAETAEERYKLEPVHFDLAPETAYDQRWAQAVIERVMSRLRAEFEAAGKKSRFDELKTFLTAESDAGPYAEVGSRLGLSEQAVKGAVFRLRQRFRELFREEIAQTLADPSELEGEIRHLLASLAA